jgi:hypothetical protein
MERKTLRRTSFLCLLRLQVLQNKKCAKFKKSMPSEWYLSHNMLHKPDAWISLAPKQRMKNTGYHIRFIDSASQAQVPQISAHTSKFRHPPKPITRTGSWCMWQWQQRMRHGQPAACDALCRDAPDRQR